MLIRLEVDNEIITKEIVILKLFIELHLPSNVLNGTVKLTLLNSSGFTLHELYYSREDSDKWNLIGTFSSGGIEWNTTKLSNGNYLLKLIGVSKTGNTYEEIYGPVIIENTIEREPGTSKPQPPKENESENIVQLPEEYKSNISLKVVIFALVGGAIATLVVLYHKREKEVKNLDELERTLESIEVVADSTAEDTIEL